MIQGNGPTGARARNPAARLVIIHALFGALLGLAFALALVLLDSRGLGRLLLASDSAGLAFALLASCFIVTFGSVVAGTAVMQIGAEKPRPPDEPASGALVPAASEAVSRAAGRRRRPGL